MAKIKNMGSATMRFGEGIIVSGTVAGSDPTHALHVSGNVRVRGHMQMGANNRIYFDGFGPSITNGPFIYGNTTSLFIDSDNRMTLSFDKDLRIVDNSNSEVIHITDKSATDSSLYKVHDDTHFFVSGAINSIDGNVFGASVYGGDLVVSGVIQGKNSSLGMGTHDLHIGSKDNFLAFGSSFQFNQDNDNIGSPGDDVFLFISGAIDGTGVNGVSVFGGDLAVSGNMKLAETATLGLSGTQDFAIDAVNDLYVSAGENLSFKVLAESGNVEFENAVTSSHFKVEGSGGQFVAFNEDTVKLKHVNWYSSNDRQYGQGQLWYQQWFGAVEPSDAGAQGGRRIGFFFHQPNRGASDADGGSGAHPTNTHMYLDLNGMYLQTGSFDVEQGDVIVSGSIKSTILGPQNEIVIVGVDNELSSSNLLTIDPTTERIGIGTTSPSVKLDMVGEASGETQIRMAQHHNGSDGPDIRFFTSRGTAAAPSAVANDDNIGRINSFAYNGTSYVQAGTFGWDADGTDGDSTFNIRTRVGGNTADRLEIDASGNVSIPGDLYFEDFLIADLSIPGLDLQTDTNAFRFNCPYNLTVEGLQLYLDQHTTSGNVTVTVTNTTDTNQMISLSITGTNTSASTTSVTNQNCDSGDIITFAITATPANAQGLRANLQFRRRG